MQLKRCPFQAHWELIVLAVPEPFAVLGDECTYVPLSSFTFADMTWFGDLGAMASAGTQAYNGVWRHSPSGVQGKPLGLVWSQVKGAN